jgi:hypothetical protein
VYLLAALSDWHKGSAHSQSQAGAEQEASGIESHNDVWLLAEFADDLQLERLQEILVKGWVGEQGQDIHKLNALDGEIRKGAEGSLQTFLRTGEFGGTGGMGGGDGLLSRGDIVGRGLLGWDGHRGREGGREEGNR